MSEYIESKAKSKINMKKMKKRERGQIMSEYIET